MKRKKERNEKTVENSLSWETLEVLFLWLSVTSSAQNRLLSSGSYSSSGKKNPSDPPCVLQKTLIWIPLSFTYRYPPLLSKPLLALLFTDQQAWALQPPSWPPSPPCCYTSNVAGFMEKKGPPHLKNERKKASLASPGGPRQMEETIGLLRGLQFDWWLS